MHQDFFFRQSPHLDAEIEAARVEILEAQADRRVALRRKQRQGAAGVRRSSEHDESGAGRRAAAAHLEVAGLAGVEDPAEEVAELAEGEEEAVAEERGERGHVREPHHGHSFPGSPLSVSFSSVDSRRRRRRMQMRCRSGGAGFVAPAN